MARRRRRRRRRWQVRENKKYRQRPTRRTRPACCRGRPQRRPAAGRRAHPRRAQRAAAGSLAGMGRQTADGRLSGGIGVSFGLPASPAAPRQRPAGRQGRLKAGTLSRTSSALPSSDLRSAFSWRAAGGCRCLGWRRSSAGRGAAARRVCPRARRGGWGVSGPPRGVSNAAAPSGEWRPRSLWWRRDKGDQRVRGASLQSMSVPATVFC